MSLTGATLYIVGQEPVEGDPLDAVALAKPVLEGAYQRVVHISPTGDRSLRVLRRAFRGERDRILYDFTRRQSAVWAGREPAISPGLILIGAARLPATTEPGRTGLRYAELTHPEWRSSKLVSLGAEIGGLPVLRRPAVGQRRKDVAVAYEIACACPEYGVPEAYAALTACNSMPKGAKRQMLILAQREEDAHEVENYRDLLGLQQLCDVRLIKRRRELFPNLASCRIVCDLDRQSWPGATDVVTAAICIGKPVIRIAGPLDEAAATIAEFRLDAKTHAVNDLYATIDPDQFGRNLVKRIELARRSISLAQGWAA